MGKKEKRTMANANEHDAQMSFLPTLCIHQQFRREESCKHVQSLKHCRASKIKISFPFFCYVKIRAKHIHTPQSTLLNDLAFQGFAIFLYLHRYIHINSEPTTEFSSLPWGTLLARSGDGGELCAVNPYQKKEVRYDHVLKRQLQSGNAMMLGTI